METDPQMVHILDLADKFLKEYYKYIYIKKNILMSNLEENPSREIEISKYNKMEILDKSAVTTKMQSSW